MSDGMGGFGADIAGGLGQASMTGGDAIAQVRQSKKKSNHDAIRDKIRARNQREDKDDDGTTSFYTKAKYMALMVLMCGTGITSILPMLSSAKKLLTVSAVQVSVKNEQQLHDVFKSGQPWLVWCINSTTDYIPAVVHQTADIVDDIADAAETFSSATIDCHAPLPSGKSVYERFRNFNSTEHMAFITANGAAPVPIPKGYLPHLKRAPKENPAVNTQRMKSLVRYVQKRIRPPSFTIGQTANLHKQCLGKKYCALIVLNTNTIGPHPREVLNTLKQQHRHIRFTTFSRYKSELSIERRFPGMDVGVEELWPRIVLFKRAINATITVPIKLTEAEQAKADAAAVKRAADEAAGINVDDEYGKDGRLKKKKSAKPTTREVQRVWAKVHTGAFSVSAINSFIIATIGDVGVSAKAAALELALDRDAAAVAAAADAGEDDDDDDDAAAGSVGKKRMSLIRYPSIRRRAAPAKDADSSGSKGSKASGGSGKKKKRRRSAEEAAAAIRRSVRDKKEKKAIDALAAADAAVAAGDEDTLTPDKREKYEKVIARRKERIEMEEKQAIKRKADRERRKKERAERKARRDAERAKNPKKMREAKTTPSSPASAAAERARRRRQRAADGAVDPERRAAMDAEAAQHYAQGVDEDDLDEDDVDEDDEYDDYADEVDDDDVVDLD